MMRTVNNLSLVDRAKAGDTAAFGQLLSEHDSVMRAVAYKMLGDQGAMDDALQAAYLKAFRNIAGFRSEAAFATWLHRIVINCCYDMLRATGRRPEISLTDAHEVASPVSHEDRLADDQQLHHALQTLPAEQRAALLLVDGEGLSYQEAAEALGVERGTIASRLNRARAELRRQLAMPEETNQ